MLDTIQFKNFDPELEQELHEKIVNLFGVQQPGVDLHAVFARSRKGLYTGSLEAVSKWGSFHARLEDINVFRLFYRLKKVMKSQMRKKKELAGHSRSEGGLDFPRHYEQLFQPTYLNLAPEPLLQDLKALKLSSVLVVDDDSEATLPIDRIFKGFGCATNCVYNFKDALQKINRHKYDVIVLDWMLDKGTGGDLIEEFLRTHEEVMLRDSLPIIERSRIVTYSGTSASGVKMPYNNFFMHVDHWDKPMKYNDMITRASDILAELNV